MAISLEKKLKKCADQFEELQQGMDALFEGIVQQIELYEDKVDDVNKVLGRIRDILDADAERGTDTDDDEDDSDDETWDGELYAQADGEELESTFQFRGEEANHEASMKRIERWRDLVLEAINRRASAR